MAQLNKIKSLSQHSTAEDYTRPFILLPFQLIFSHSDDNFDTRGFQYDGVCQCFEALKPVHEFGQYQRRIL